MFQLISKFLYRLSLLVLFLVHVPSQGEEWVVLPNQIRPNASPSKQATALSNTLSFPQIVSGNLLPMGSLTRQSGRLQWVKVLIDGRNSYLPLPMLVKNTALPTKGNLPIGEEIVDKDHPLPLDYKPSDLVDLSGRWSYQSGAKFQMRAEAARMAEKMLLAAQQAGVQLRIASSYRSATSQRYNYLRKISQTQIDQRVVAKPGHSEHQLGTVVDLSALDPKTSLQPAFSSTPEGQWLRDNCRQFGFVQSYTPENSEKKGYIPEPWHFRYVGKMSRSWK